MKGVSRMPKLNPGELIVIPSDLYQKMIDRVGLQIILRTMREQATDAKTADTN